VLRQSRGARPITELTLSRGSFRSCRGRSRRVVRRLEGVATGRFRIRGRRARAMSGARATRWLVQDRCDGTRTVVRRGTATVGILRTGRNRAVRSGRSLLVRR
jgi:hypothetical protein